MKSCAVVLTLGGVAATGHGNRAGGYAAGGYGVGGYGVGGIGGVGGVGGYGVGGYGVGGVGGYGVGGVGGYGVGGGVGAFNSGYNSYSTGLLLEEGGIAGGPGHGGPPVPPGHGGGGPGGGKHGIGGKHGGKHGKQIQPVAQNVVVEEYVSTEGPIIENQVNSYDRQTAYAVTHRPVYHKTINNHYSILDKVNKDILHHVGEQEVRHFQVPGEETFAVAENIHHGDQGHAAYSSIMGLNVQQPIVGVQPLLQDGGFEMQQGAQYGAGAFNTAASGSFVTPNYNPLNTVGSSIVGGANYNTMPSAISYNTGAFNTAGSGSVVTPNYNPLGNMGGASYNTGSNMAGNVVNPNYSPLGNFGTNPMGNVGNVGGVGGGFNPMGNVGGVGGGNVVNPNFNPLGNVGGGSGVGPLGAQPLGAQPGFNAEPGL